MLKSVLFLQAASINQVSGFSYLINFIWGTPNEGIGSAYRRDSEAVGKSIIGIYTPIHVYLLQCLLHLLKSSLIYTNSFNN